MNKVKRKIIKIDEEKCDGCALCIPSCPEGALQIVDTPKGPKARLVKENFCDGLGACLGDCPQGALNVVESKSERYDEEGVIAHIKENAPEKLEKHLKHLKEHADELPQHHSHQSLGMSGCPGSKVMSWGEKKQEAGSKKQEIKAESELRQWPVQLTLVNPQAPYFSLPGGTDLLIAADCVPFAYANFHNRFLKDSIVIIFCPKLDSNLEGYVEKLATIIKDNDIKSITIVRMEVPCCGGITKILKEALKKSGKNIIAKEYIISLKGDLI